MSHLHYGYRSLSFAHSKMLLSKTLTCVDIGSLYFSPTPARMFILAYFLSPPCVVHGFQNHHAQHLPLSMDVPGTAHYLHIPGPVSSAPCRWNYYIETCITDTSHHLQHMRRSGLHLRLDHSRLTFPT